MRLDNKKNVKRLVIYFFYDKNGVVDRYIPYLLEDMNKNCSELFIVCNGKLTKEGRETLGKLTPHILVRENKGFDVWAYKTALEQYGWDRLAEYDEVIMMNHTIMGPVYPFSEMFEEMDGRDLDFWGITKFHKHPGNPYDIEYGYLPEHIQSHFIAVRNTMLRSPEFRYYWETRPEIKEYGDAVGKHEAIFTRRFSDAGFEWECYVDTTDLDDMTFYPLMYLPIRLLKEYRCPIFKRRTFFQPCVDMYSYSEGMQARELMDYLEAHTSYDTSMIWENILRTNNMADIKNCMDLNYIVPEHGLTGEPPKAKLALVIHIYFEELIRYCFDYALSMPEDSDIYITVGSEEKKKKVEEIFKDGPWNHVEVILVENRGRDVSALLIGTAPYLDKYDYVCFMHDKKVTQLDYGIKGLGFSERCFHNLLGSKELVLNIVSLFEQDRFLGLLCPPPPNHADYYSTLGCEWGMNYDVTEELYDELELNVPIDIRKEPVTPLGTMFWFRPAAMKKLFEYEWKYKDFEKEPIETDGTLLHAVERIYGFVVQDAGYYPAWVMSDEYTRLEWSKLSYMLREVNIRAFRAYGISDLYTMTTIMDYYSEVPGDPKNPVKLRRIIKHKLKGKIPKPIWAVMKKLYHAFGGKKWAN